MRLIQNRTVAALVLALAVVLPGCSREPVQASDAPPSSEQLPFDRPADTAGFAPTGLIPERGIPAGTPVTVLLRSAISSQNSKAGDPFDAVLDEPIQVNGELLIAPGAEVGGRILQCDPGNPPSTGGYVRLELTSITTSKETLNLATASIFLKAMSRPNEALSHTQSGAQNNSEITLPINHRITFRLTRQVRLPG